MSRARHPVGGCGAVRGNPLAGRGARGAWWHWRASFLRRLTYDIVERVRRNWYGWRAMVTPLTGPGYETWQNLVARAAGCDVRCRRLRCRTSAAESRFVGDGFRDCGAFRLSTEPDDSTRARGGGAWSR